jgi:hypothetical protein
MELDDARWKGLVGGYRLLYDPRPALEAIKNGTDATSAWRELWNGLHHQGSVGDASYASIPVLVEIQNHRGDLGWNLYALASCIEIQRHLKKNPPLPDWLALEYKQAWYDLVEFALKDIHDSDDPLVIRTALAACAVGRGQVKLGTIICYSDASEIDELVEIRMAWSQRYDETDLLE